MNSLIRTVAITVLLVCLIVANVIASDYKEPTSHLRKETRDLVFAVEVDDPGVTYFSAGDDLTCSSSDQLLFQGKPLSQKDCFNFCKNTPGCTYFASNLPPTKDLIKVGNDGSPANVFPLGECQGDCDSDSDCQPGLLCFQRNGKTPVPGCTGEGQNSKDYCYDPNPPGLPQLKSRGNNGSPGDAFPLGNCEGDCDRDKDCRPGLKCFQRNDETPVPGCAGAGKRGEDYCYFPDLSASTRMLQAPDADDRKELMRVGNNGSPSSAFPLAECEGDCDRDGDCQDGLICFQRTGFETVDGCFGEDELKKGTDVCIVGPTLSPTASPSDYTGSFLKLVYVGDCDNNKECQAENFPLQACEGDCDNDSDCEPGLLCFQRNGNETPPGCRGEGIKGRDYCYNPGTSSPTPAPSSAPETCFLCQSDNNLEPFVGFDLFEVVDATFYPTISPPPKVCEAGAWGDPHIVTWDGLKFDAQPKGDAIFITDSASPLEVQGRLEKLREKSSLGGPAVITGITAKGNVDSSPIIQVSVADPDIVALGEGGFIELPVGSKGDCPIEVVVNGESQELFYDSGDGASVSLIDNGERIKIEYSSTLSIEMELRKYGGRCYFSVDFTLSDCETYEDTVIGILGSPNGNSQDDWMTPEYEVLPLPEGGVKKFFFRPAFDYVRENWIITNEIDSLFNYDGDLVTFEEYFSPEEEYDDTVEQLLENPDPAIGAICQGNVQCLIDGEELGLDAANDFITNPNAERVTIEEETADAEEEAADADSEDASIVEEEEDEADNPTTNPTLSPTGAPIPTLSPTGNPTAFPTVSPTKNPTLSPTGAPIPTLSPTENPTAFPTVSPITSPTTDPTKGNQFDKLSEDETDDLIFAPIGPEQCPDDILLVTQTGITPFPDSAVRITSQDMTTVTVELVQTFTDSSTSLDSVFYLYRDSTFHTTCPEVDNFIGEDLVEFEITCTSTSKTAFLEIWVADDVTKGVLSEGDNAVVPKCCHPDFPEGKPATMYYLEIKCDSSCPNVVQ